MRQTSIFDQPTVFFGSFNKLPINSSNPEFSNDFFVDLATLIADTKMVIEDRGALSAAKAIPKMRKGNNSYLSPRLKMPALVVESAVFLDTPPIQSKNNSRKRHKVSWAGDSIEIITRSIRNRGAGQLEVIREAKVSVKDMRKVSLLKKGLIDRDVYYDPRAGQFRLDLRVLSHESCIGLLAHRLKAIDQVVNFVASIGGIKGVNCESVTLRKLIFTYSDPGSIAPASQRPWRVTLDLARNTVVVLVLEPDSPHRRISDMLEKLINSSVGFEQLPYWLQTSLPLHRALDTVENAWDNLSRNAQGSFEALPRAIDWVAVNFELPPSGPNKPPRRLHLNVNVVDRQGENYWAIRLDPIASGQQPDDFKAALQPIFGGADMAEGWKGLGDSAVATVASGGVEPLLMRISDAVRAMATGGGAQQQPRGAGAGGSSGAPITLD